MAGSMIAHFISVCLRFSYKPSERRAEADLERRRRRGEKESRKPLGRSVRSDGRIFYANENAASDRIVFFLHGGGYWYDFSPVHWHLVRKIIARTDAMVIAPAYRLIPFATWRDAFDLIVPVYRHYAENEPEKKIILLGGSAGGGLALSLAEYFQAEGIRKPDEIILLSPWVDVSMDNPDVIAWQKQDPWLTIPWLKVCGRHWAGETDVHDYRVSPIYGDLRGLSNITAFVGTKELFYPELLKLFGLLEQEGNEGNELIIGQGMNHVFPELPIPDAIKYRAKIFETIRR